MTDTQHLLDNRFQLIEWNALSQKWQDRGNDFFCSDRTGRGWLFTARRGFEDGRREVRFESEHEALEAFVNHLFGRQMRMAGGESASWPELVDRRYEVVQWVAESEKWIDSGGNFFLRDMGGFWRAGARYDFAAGCSTIDFEDRHEAFSFYVNFLFSRMMRLIEGRQAA